MPDYIKKNKSFTSVSKDYTTKKETVVAKVEEPIATPQPVIKTIKPKLNKNFLGNIGISLTQKKETNKTTEEEATEDLTNKPRTPFEFNDLYRLWKEYSKKIRAKGKESFYTTLIKHKPQLLDNYKVQITIENKVQQTDVILESPDLLGYLRRNLNNYGISLETLIIQPKQEDVLYTSRDKYKRMAEKNPYLNKLREKFDLDIEY